MGRPPLYDSIEQMQPAIDAYFAKQDKGKPREIVTKQGDVVTIMKPQPYSRAGLALALGFVSTQSLNDYAKKSGEFSEALTRARTMIEDNRLTGILTGEQDSKAGWNDLASHHDGYQPKLQLPEGATIMIGIQQPAKAIEGEEEKPALDQPAKPVALTD